MNGIPPVILWFHRDLRLDDHPPLHEAASAGRPVVPVFIWSPDEEKPWSMGAAQRVWLHETLTRLNNKLRDKGAPLVYKTGSSLQTLERLIAETGAQEVWWIERQEPVLKKRDAVIARKLQERGVGVRIFESNTLFAHRDILSAQGTPLQVFTPFWRRCLMTESPTEPVGEPRKLVPCPAASDSLEGLALLPKIRWDGEIHASWKPGPDAAKAVLDDFLGRVGEYAAARDIPARIGTSRLSPYLALGVISVRRVWRETLRRIENSRLSATAAQSADVFLKEIGWREFAHHLLRHFPHTTDAPLKESFGRFPWRKDSRALAAWRRGRTGYPIVDAGMRELWQTGWMHNRVRMIAGSFLVKDLLIDWREGARWFWDTLIDADLANNTLGWQWVAGCGADAAPFFRIFNPALQAQKFDPAGEYLSQWEPNQRHPIVDHGAARAAALRAYKNIC